MRQFPFVLSLVTYKKRLIPTSLHPPFRQLWSSKVPSESPRTSALLPASHTLVRLSGSFHCHLCRGRDYPSLAFHRRYFPSKADNSLGSRGSGDILSLQNCTEFTLCFQRHFFSTTSWSRITRGQPTTCCFQWSLPHHAEDNRNNKTLPSTSPVPALQCRQTTAPFKKPVQKTMWFSKTRKENWEKSFLSM